MFWRRSGFCFRVITAYASTPAEFRQSDVGRYSAEGLLRQVGRRDGPISAYDVGPPPVRTVSRGYCPTSLWRKGPAIRQPRGLTLRKLCGIRKISIKKALTAFRCSGPSWKVVRDSRFRGNDGFRDEIPAFAGMTVFRDEIPAFAGMT